ncbi:hypothetical protein GCM10010252_03820 [Streptomyces aureoverticillatus]|nr:hypothetical protein GCM10010252_03820 [Streptomyces aureoverticillatus]
MNLRDLRSSRSCSRSRRGALALGLAVATVLAAGAAAPVSAQSAQDTGGAPGAHGVRAELPAPTGPHAIGTFSTRLVDRSRHDPWVTSQPYRELMVNVWYPARASGGHGVAPYMAEGAAARWDATGPHGIPKGAVDWAGMRTHAREGAPLDKAAGGGRLPVLVYSAGAGDPRSWGTALVEDMASRGYVVVTVDHTYESPGVQFPDGSVKDNKPLLDALAQTPPEKMSPLLKKVLDIRVADDKFVLDRLGALPHGLGKAVDRNRIGMFGHSAGGIAAAETMYEDKRVKAGLNMDGTLENNPEPNGTNLTPVAEHGLDHRPFLLMGRDGSDHTTEPSWRSFWKHSPGWKRDLNLRGSKHQTFTDLAAILPQAGVGRDVIEKNIGTVDPARATAAQRAYVASFFDRRLGGRDDHLLDGPSDRFPEVRFVRP